MFTVIPGEKIMAKLASILYRTEISRELRAIFQRFELRFRVGGGHYLHGSDSGSSLLPDPPADRRRFLISCYFPGLHEAPVGPVGFVVFAGIIDQTFGKDSLFAVSDHPADHILAEYVQDDIEMKIGPLGGVSFAKINTCKYIVTHHALCSD